ncbi:MAG: hypothetical protein K6E62_13760, partial [Lachnospiraceae bacterium]|nr:hypothetical protein [Lachnospiraceae bacterium]
MAQSTEDYLDSLLRQAMGIPDPEPAAKPAEHPADLERDSVLEMADGLTGSNSAILGNVYDHNASFTNEGEIEIPSAPAAETVPASEIQQTNAPEQAAGIPAEEMPDPDAPPVIGRTIAEDTSMITEDLLPNIDDVLTSPENQEPAVAEEPAIPVP